MEKTYLLDHKIGLKCNSCKWESSSDFVSLYGNKHDGKMLVSPTLLFSQCLQSAFVGPVKVDRFHNPGFRKSLLHVCQCCECFLRCFMLVQASWASLRTEFAALNPAQLHHMLREYSSTKACPPGWTPSPDDADDAIRTGEWHGPSKISSATETKTIRGLWGIWIRIFRCFFYISWSQMNQWWNVFFFFFAWVQIRERSWEY